MGIIGALLALPITAGLLMMLEELRVELPGDDSVDRPLQAGHARQEAKYELMSAGATAPGPARSPRACARQPRSGTGRRREARAGRDGMTAAAPPAPAVAPLAPAAVAAPTIDAGILRARVLIVDDKEANVILLERMLRGAGYTGVASTRDPLTVCALHAAQRFDLILLDLQMPGMDGFAVMEGLKKVETDGYLPVLVITAQPNHKLRALKTGPRTSSASRSTSPRC